MASPFVAGWQRITTSGVIGDSGKPIWVTAYMLENSGATGIPYFLSGSSGSGAIAFRGNSTAGANNMGAPQDLGAWPVVFPVGMFVSFDAGTAAVSVLYTQT